MKKNVKIMALYKQIFFFALGPVLCFLLKDLTPPEPMTAVGMKCLAGCMWLLVWWVFEVLPLPVTSLIAVPVFGFLDLMSPTEVFALIGHPAMMLIFGATIIVGVWKESNLIQRYAYWCFNLPFVKGKPLNMIFVFTFGAGLLSSIAPNIPLIILFTSVSVAMAKSCELAPDGNLLKSFFTLSAISPALGGMGTPLGGAPNILIIAMIATILDHDVTFFQWTALGMPLVLIILLCCFIVTVVLFPLSSDKSCACLDSDSLKDKLKDLGPVTLYEHIAVWVMLISLILWCAGPNIFSMLGFEKEAKMMTAPVVALLMGTVCFILPIKRDEETGKMLFAMNWKQAVNNIGWGIIVLQIGAVAFGEVLLQGGIDKWIAQNIQGIIGNISGIWVWFALVLFTGLICQIIMSLALIPVMLPITASLAQIYHFDPLLACLSVGFVTNLTTMFPFSSIAVAVVLGESEGMAQSKDFILSGFVITLITTLVSFLFCYFVGGCIL